MLERQKNALQNLQKQNKLEDILVKIIYVILFIAFNIFELYIVYLIGKYTNTLHEMTFIVIFFFLNKAMFGNALHFKKNRTCLLVSIVAFYMSGKTTLNLGLSIFSSMVVGVLCASVTSYIATYVMNKKKTTREQIIEILNGNTSQEYIFEYCRQQGHKQYIADTIDLFLNNTLEETSQILDVEIRTIQRRIKKFIEKH